MEDNIEGTDEVKSEKKPKKIPIPTFVPVLVTPTTVPSDKRYKMNLYTSNGLLRSELARGTFTTMSTRYGDIIRSISLNHWCTFPEIVVAYANLAKRLRFEPRRTPEQIEIAISDMIEAGMIDVK